MFYAVEFPDPVRAVIAHLGAELPDHGYPSAPVRKNVPNPRPSLFCRVFRSGGPKLGHVIDNPQITVECWGDDDVALAHFTTVVRALILGMRGQTVGSALCVRVDEFSGPADLPDPVSDQSRLTWSASLRFRGSALTSA